MEDKRTEEARSKYIGKRYWTRDGKNEFVIIEYNSYSDVTVEFVNSGFIKHTNIGNINAGLVNPFKDSPVAFEDPIRAMLNTYHQTNNSCPIKITNIESLDHVQYQFQDEYGYIGITSMQNIKKGQVRNPYQRNTNGSYLGISPYTGNKYHYIMNRWRNVVNRGTGYREKYTVNRDYIDYYNSDCGICDEWMCYANFAEWFLSSLSMLNHNYEYEINKDLLYPIYSARSGGIKYYSPETVELIPIDLNSIICKHVVSNPDPSHMQYIRDITMKYYYDGALTDRARDAILKFHCGDTSINIPYIYIKKKDVMKNHYVDEV